MATSDRRSYPWPRVLPPLGVSYLRSSEFLWGRPRQCPRKPCWAPTRAYPKSRGPGGATCPLPKPLSRWSHCVLQVFHFSGLTLLFQRRHVSSCLFPIVKAISVRPQYFKDETKQFICLGNQKSPLVCPFSKEQGFGSSSSWDLPFSHAPLCPCVILQGASVCVYVCDGEPSCTPLVCLSLSSILGRMVILKSLGVLGQRQAGTSPGALGLPKP